MVVGICLFPYGKCIDHSDLPIYFLNMERVLEVEKCNHIIFCGKARPLRCVSAVILFLQWYDRLHQALVSFILIASKTPAVLEMK
jgi:hypothetical protein